MNRHLRRAENLLAKAVFKLVGPPRETIWEQECQDCGKVFRTQRHEYLDHHDYRNVSHGICPRCDAVRAGCETTHRRVDVFYEDLGDGPRS